MSTGDGMSSAPPIEQSAMVSGRGKDRDRSRDFGGHGPLEGDVAHMMVDRVALIKDHVNANIVG